MPPNTCFIAYTDQILAAVHSLMWRCLIGVGYDAIRQERLTQEYKEVRGLLFDMKNIIEKAQEIDGGAPSANPWNVLAKRLQMYSPQRSKVVYRGTECAYSSAESIRDRLVECAQLKQLPMTSELESLISLV